MSPPNDSANLGVLGTPVHRAEPSPCLLVLTSPRFRHRNGSTTALAGDLPAVTDTSARNVRVYGAVRTGPDARRAPTSCLSPCGYASPCAATCLPGARSGPAPRGVTARTPRTARRPGRRGRLRPRSGSLPGLSAPRSCPADASYSGSSCSLLVCIALLLCKRRKKAVF